MKYLVIILVLILVSCSPVKEKNKFKGKGNAYGRENNSRNLEGDITSEILDCFNEHPNEEIVRVGEDYLVINDKLNVYDLDEDCSLSSTIVNFLDFEGSLFKVFIHESAIFVSGNFNVYRGEDVAHGIIKLDLEGNIDEDFQDNLGLGFDNTIIDFLIEDNSIYLTGNFRSYGFLEKDYIASSIAKISLTGEFDYDFNDYARDGFEDVIREISLDEETLFLVGDGDYYELNLEEN